MKHWRNWYIGLGVILGIFGMVVTGCYHRAEIYTPGTYRGETEGYYSPMIVDVTVDAYQITAIQVISLDETPIITETVVQTLPKRIIKANSTAVDTISGATATSKGMIEAVDRALAKARKE